MIAGEQGVQSDAADPPIDAPTSGSGPQAGLIAVGRVVDAYGVHGWVKIQPYNAPQESVLRSCRQWWLPDGTQVRVERARIHAATIVAKPADAQDRDEALAFRGLELRVDRAEFPAAAADEYYWVDLVGCAVTNPAGDDLGVVGAVEDFGAHPILKTRDAAGRDRLIPFVEVHILEVDIAARRIVADWQPDY